MAKIYISSLYDGEPPYSGHLEHLIVYLSRNGVLPSRLEGADSALLIDYQPQKLRSLIKRGIPKNRRFLVIREPEQIHPSAYRSNYMGQFGKVFGMGQCINGKVEFPWAYQEAKDWETFFLRTDRNSSLSVSVASWRFSLIKGSYYTLRNEVFSLPNNHLYGFGWEDGWQKKTKEVLKQLVTGIKNPEMLSLMPLFDLGSYKVRGLGKVENKLELLSKYKVSLVIENSGNYFSEKLFDAIYAGCIPVYVGPSVETIGLNSGYVIQAEPNLLSISQGIQKALSMPRDDWANKMLNFIKAGNLNAWKSEESWSKVAESVTKSLFSEL